MNDLEGTTVLLGVTGGIAAYKAAYIVRGLVRRGADVRVVMTPAARDFITPLTLATLSKHPVPSQLFDDEGNWADHVHLGTASDVIVIAPATANTLAKMAHGLCDNLLLATYLSATCPVLVSPAMDLDMWNHPATRRNLETLRSDGVHVLEPDAGELASGLTGPGRLPEPEAIIDKTVRVLAAR